MADRGNKSLKKISPAGMVSSVAEGLQDITCVTVDRSGNIYYGAYGCVKKITPAGITSIVAGKGSAGSNFFIGPRAMATNANGDIYIVEGFLIRKLSAAGILTILAGSTRMGSADGYGADAQFWPIYGITVDPRSGFIYVTENGTYDNGAASIRLRRISQDGDVNTVTAPGGGPLPLGQPYGVVVDDNGAVFVIDQHSNSIKKIVLQ